MVNEQATTPLFHEGYVFGDQTNPRRRTFSTNYLEHWSTTTEYDCCVVTNEFDREGIQTSFIYDNLNRRTGSKRAGIETLDILDAAGNVVTNARVGTDESVMVLSISAYDVNGELVSQTVPGLGTTTFTNYDDGTYLVRKTINPDESYRLEKYYADGQLAEVGGSAAMPVKYEYGADADGVFTKEIKVVGGATNERVRERVRPIIV